jgi:hypothetical protein
MELLVREKIAFFALLSIANVTIICGEKDIKCGFPRETWQYNMRYYQL